ncbi:MAG: glutathione peroxidase [Bacteroidota bacterium]
MNHTNHKSKTSIYEIETVSNTGKSISLEQFRGKYLLIVNLASNCGFTGQYAELEELYQQNREKLVVLGFPANDFGGQEPGSDEAIASFCQVNFGVSFPLFKKDSVKGAGMQTVYQLLTDPSKNGWNTEAPSWNFCKYLVSPTGELLSFHTAAVSPVSPKITNQLV